MALVPNSFIDISTRAQGDIVRQNTEAMIADPTPHLLSANFSILFSIVFVTIESSNSFRVYFSEEPKHQSPIGTNDVLNRLNWTISVLNGQGTAPVVEDIENVQSAAGIFTLYPTAWSVDVRVDRPLRVDTQYLVVVGTNVQTAGGAPLAVAPNNQGQTYGNVPAPKRQPLPNTSVREGIDFAYDLFGGAFKLDGKGDVSVQSGIDQVKKLVIRRLLSTPGGFYHLKDYGVGLRTKEIYKTTRIAQMQTRIKQQVLLEPEVKDVSVTVSVPTQGVLLVQLSVRTQSNDGFDVAVQFPQTGPVLIM